MDPFQSPSLNDQRRISTTELAIGFNPAGLSAPSPDAAPQPAPVNQTTLVPSAEKLKALAQQVALVSGSESSNQRIKVQEVSSFSAGLQLVEPSIRLFPRDQVASDSPSFGRRTKLSLVGFFTAAHNWLASHGPSFGRASATLDNFFIAVSNWLASHRPLFGRPSATPANLFIAARNWLATYGPSFGSRTATLASFFMRL